MGRGPRRALRRTWPASRRSLRETRDLLTALQNETVGFDSDRDLIRDVGMLDEYVRLLETGVGDAEPTRLHLADSLRYAGRLKVLPRPAEDSRN